MKKVFLSIAAIAALTISSVSAQNAPLGFSWGPKAGINLSDITNNSNFKHKVGFTGGGFVEYGFCHWFSLSADLLYSRQGARMNDFNEAGVRFTKARITTDYLNLPILANFYVVEGLAIKTGIQPGLLLGANARQTVNGTKENFFIKDQFQTFDFSIPIGVSYSFDFGLILDARYIFGVSKLNANKERYGMWRAKDHWDSVASFTVGWRF